MIRTLIVLGAVFAFLGVGLGAFGAHALEAHFEANPDREPTYQTASEYHLTHALGLLVLGLAGGKLPRRLTLSAGALFAVGILLFSGSLYVLAITGVSILGAVAPLGGLAFLSGWACVAVAGWRVTAQVGAEPSTAHPRDSRQLASGD